MSGSNRCRHFLYHNQVDFGGKGLPMVNSGISAAAGSSTAPCSAVRSATGGASRTHIPEGEQAIRRAAGACVDIERIDSRQGVP